ncbi:MAG: DUF488 domain-containing protein [Gemmatimonadaceae bacterium]
MAIRIVRLGSLRQSGEGLRIGTVRRPPRGVPKSRYAADDWYDVWLPNLSPSAALLRRAQKITGPREWRAFERSYRSEMKRPEQAHLLNVLAALSHQVDLSVGCYCEDEQRCHRSILRMLLEERGAAISGAATP